MKKTQRYQRTINVKDLLESSAFSDVMKKGLLINEIHSYIQKVIPNQFHTLYQVANINGQSLTIQVANATVRQGFLFHQQELLRLIQQNYPEIMQLSFRLEPDFRVKGHNY